MLVLGSGAHEARSVESGGLNHGSLGDIRGRCAGRSGCGLGRSRAGEANELPGGVEFLILGAQAFALQTEKLSRAGTKLPDLPACGRVEQAVERASGAGKNLTHCSLRQSTQRASDGRAKRASHRRRGPTQQTTEKLIQFLVISDPEQLNGEFLLLPFTKGRFRVRCVGRHTNQFVQDTIRNRRASGFLGVFCPFGERSFGSTGLSAARSEGSFGMTIIISQRPAPGLELLAKRSFP